jgi:hypothetical protein
MSANRSPIRLVGHISFADDADKLFEWVRSRLRLASISLADDARRVVACGSASAEPFQQAADDPGHFHPS